MAYDCLNGCSRVPHVSNPEVSYAGAPTGVPDYADNALALADTAPMVATCREGQVPMLPLSPTDLSASAQGHERIDLAWSEAGALEDGYEIERSSDGGDSWSPVASLAADVSGYGDAGLEAATFYLYRVRAFGPGGESAWSASAGAETHAPASVCQVEGAASLALSDKAATWTLSNTGAGGALISRIEVSWLSAQGSLPRVSLDGSTIWRGNVAPMSADIASGWSGSVSDRALAAGQSADLTLSFSRRYSGDGQDDYAITVHFAEGCSVSF